MNEAKNPKKRPNFSFCRSVLPFLSKTSIINLDLVVVLLLLLLLLSSPPPLLLLLLPLLLLFTLPLLPLPLLPLPLLLLLLLSSSSSPPLPLLLLPMFPRWLRPMVGIVLVFSLLSFGHVVYLRFRPEIRRMLRFPPLPPASTPYPPLPFIEDLDVLVDFFRTSLDDVAEDVTKAACVATSYSIGWSLVGDQHFRLARTAGTAVGLGAYMACDRAGDTVGDYAASGITSTMAWLG